MSQASDTRSRVATRLMYIKLKFNKGDNQKMHFSPSSHYSHSICESHLKVNCIYNLSWHLITFDSDFRAIYWLVF